VILSGADLARTREGVHTVSDHLPSSELDVDEWAVMPHIKESMTLTYNRCCREPQPLRDRRRPGDCIHSACLLMIQNKLC
jgi:hypothetical protein